MTHEIEQSVSVLGHGLKNAYPAVDLSQTRQFLATLDPSAQQWCFRTFPDVGNGAASNYTGALDDVAMNLELDNGNGRGVFVVINSGGHKAADIDRIRAVWADFDGPSLPASLPLDPNIVVESSPGKYHAYWLVDGMPLETFKSVQLAIAARCGSDPSVCDLSRVMRLPGFIHNKEAPFLTKLRHKAADKSFGQDAP